MNIIFNVVGYASFIIICIYFINKIIRGIIYKHLYNKNNKTNGEIIEGNCIKYNANPFANKAGDCAIRAICKIEGYSWHRAYNKLCKLGAKNCLMPNDFYNIIKFFNNQKYHIYKPLQYISYRGFTNSELKGKFYLISDGHICACIDNKLYDSFNSNLNVIKYVISKSVIKDKRLKEINANEIFVKNQKFVHIDRK